MGKRSRKRVPQWRGGLTASPVFFVRFEQAWLLSCACRARGKYSPVLITVINYGCDLTPRPGRRPPSVGTVAHAALQRARCPCSSFPVALCPAPGSDPSAASGACRWPVVPSAR